MIKTQRVYGITIERVNKVFSKINTSKKGYSFDGKVYALVGFVEDVLKAEDYKEIQNIIESYKKTF